MFAIIYFVLVYFKFVCFVFFRIVLILLCICLTFFFVVCSGFFWIFFCMFNEVSEVVSFIVVNLFFVSHEKVSFGLIEIVVGINSVL